MTAHRAHVGPPTLTQDAICSGTPADRVEKNCSVQRSWAIQHPSQRLLSGPKSFSHNQDPKAKSPTAGGAYAAEPKWAIRLRGRGRPQ